MDRMYVLISFSIIYVLVIVRPISAMSCEPIVVPLCTGHLPYNHTTFPNVFNHSSQEEAGMEVAQFWPLIEIGCSAALRQLLCVMYVPPCNIANIVVPPCRELCEESQRGCGDLMRQFGFSWPETLSCDIFPKYKDDVCFISDSLRQSVDAAPVTEASVKHPEVAEPKCEMIKSTFCSGHIPYTSTMFPNILNHPNQAEAAKELEMYFPLVEMDCSPPLLRLFVCSAYNPYCVESSGVIVSPCREFCEQATTGCTGFDNQLGFVWPRYMSCSRFPSQVEEPLCLMPQHFHPPSSTITLPTTELEEELGGDNDNMTELIAVFRERVQAISENMRTIRAENIQLQEENQELRGELTELREELATSRGVNMAKMEKFETTITEKLTELKRTIYNSLTTTGAEISSQIQQSCEN